MTYKAREVLGDCRVALCLLEDEADAQRWRIHWAAAVALIRAVGHVLHKVDGRDARIKDVVDAAFRDWKGADSQHEIFREFIERERNNLLKEYRSGVHPLPDVPLLVELCLQPVDGGSPVTSIHYAEIGENIYRPLVEGPWEGEDAREVLGEAIVWWDAQLTAIEQEVARRKTE